MNDMKKMIAFCLWFWIISSSLTLASTTLYQRETENRISSGAKLIQYNLLTEDGWLDIHVLKIDLTDKYTKIGVLTSSEGSGKLKNVLSMAQESAAIAAVNADFFSGKAGNGHSIGLAITDSKLLSSAANENQGKPTYATFAMDEDQNVFMDYFTNQITLTSKKTSESVTISVINKYANSYETPTLYTRAWGETSIGSSDSLYLTEMIVEDNRVVAIQSNQPAVTIPEDGFVVAATGANAEFLYENFPVGTQVDLQITYMPDQEEIAFAISGGAKLLENGTIPETFSHTISGRNPRTALGLSKDEETLYLVTVDGRLKTSIGMTQTELAEFLKSISVYNAINLDGGGSTTMVARPLGSFSTMTVNRPSDGALRSVINAIGVFSTAPDSDRLSNLVLSVEDTNVFVGEKRKVQVTGYNRYDNPVEIDFDDIDWDYDGVRVKVDKEGMLSGSTVGSTILTASIGRAKAEIEINILSEANELTITPKITSISPNKEVGYTVQAKNKNGYYAKTDASTITATVWEYYKDHQKQTAIPSDATISEDFVFTAKTAGEYILSFTKGEITSYALVSVDSQQETVLDDFESQTFSFDEYPDEVKGDAYLSKKQVYSGNSSVCLEYDFRQDIQIRGAYIELNEPYTIPEEATSLGFWVYNPADQEVKLKIKVKDAKGAYHLIVLQDAITHTGWKEVVYNLSSIALPATLTDIYLAQDNLAIQETGYIYVDHLVYYSHPTKTEIQVRLPKDKKAEDANNPSFITDSAYQLAVLDTLSQPVYLLDVMKQKTLYATLNRQVDATLFTEATDSELTSPLTTKVYQNTGYDVIEVPNATILMVDIGKGGIRSTNAMQWLDLQDDIQEADTHHVLIVFNGSLDTFQDENERKLLIDALCEWQRETKKQITVLHTGYYNDYSMERGVKFLGLQTQNLGFDEVAKDYSYLQLSITKDDLYYEYKPFFEIASE